MVRERRERWCVNGKGKGKSQLRNLRLMLGRG
jgi:hypothetical protein